MLYRLFLVSNTCNYIFPEVPTIHLERQKTGDYWRERLAAQDLKDRSFPFTAGQHRLLSSLNLDVPRAAPLSENIFRALVHDFSEELRLLH